MPRTLSLVMLTLLPSLLGSCGGEGGRYSGTWKRELYGEGQVQMKLASNGGVELTLPSRRWTDSVMKSRATFKGDTLLFQADTSALPCQTAAARYVVSRTEDQLQIAGIGADSCGGRRAALVGTWEKS
ncbi:MAG TPA: hypothetical protein VFH26_07650 [Gemmatimonadales bacterium]|nr:hypothetical protein [Gemmatimonadales bacterium]